MFRILLLCCFLLPGVAFAQTSRPSTQPTTQKVKSKASFPSVFNQQKKKDPMDRFLLRVAQLLSTFLLEHGLDEKNPWLLSHSLLAFGKNLKLKNGKKVVDHIVETSLKQTRQGGLTLYHFPRGTNKHRIEPHPHMHLKTFMEIGLPMNYKFPYKGKKVSLRKIFRSAQLSIPPAPKGKEMGKLAWLLGAMYGNMKKGEWIWSNKDGKKVNFFRVLRSSFVYLDKLTTFLRTFKTKGVKVIPKLRLRGQFVYGEPCGGFHLIQSAMLWMNKKPFKKSLQMLSDAQIELLFYRYKAEVRLYTRLFKKYQKHAAYRFIILLQQLKFVGHWLETITVLKKANILILTKDYKSTIRSAAKLLGVTILLLDRFGFYGKKQLEKLRTLNAQTFQFYLDLLGDSAHALHALKHLLVHPIYRR